MRNHLTYGLLLASILALLGCSTSSEDEVRQWMAEQRKQTQPKVTPIVEPKQFKPESYVQTSALEPFSREKLTQALKGESTQATSNAALVAPELLRRKEALESYPLDAIAMVGSLVRSGEPVALIRVNNLLYQVKPGNYLGQNFGRVTKIVQDAVGEWIERSGKLQLQEGTK